jgi:hypothetical protein
MSNFTDLKIDDLQNLTTAEIEIMYKLVKA